MFWGLANETSDMVLVMMWDKGQEEEFLGRDCN